MSIQEFIENFEGGTRKNRFRVKMITEGAPEYVAANFDDFHIQAAAMPASILTTNPIDFQGRKILYPGDRIYSADGFNVWTMSVLDDKDDPAGASHKNLWEALHAWSHSINDHDENTGNPNQEATIVVEQLNLNDQDSSGGDGGGVIKTATLYGCWPQSIGPIEMEMQARDQYNSFEVTFCFKYVKYEDNESSSGNPSPEP